MDRRVSVELRWVYLGFILHHDIYIIIKVTSEQGQSPSYNPPWARGRTPPRGCSAQAGVPRRGKPRHIRDFHFQFLKIVFVFGESYLFGVLEDTVGRGANVPWYLRYNSRKTSSQVRGFEKMTLTLIPFCL